MKYMLSDEEYSYYKYGDWDAPAYCRGNSFPQFWNGKEWRQISFLKFADNAVQITEEEFKKLVEQNGCSF